MDLSWLVKIAPTVASALGGPLAGIAVAAVSKALGVEPEKVTDVLQSGQLSGDQIVALKTAEMELQGREKELGFKFAELEFKDRDSARQREMAVKDNTNKVLAYTVVGAFVAMVAGTLLGYAKIDSVLSGTLVGYLSAKAEQVLAYYFGSSIGSKSKDNALADIAKMP